MEKALKFGLRISLLQEIRDIASRNRLSKVILFGSRARGDHRERSDIDLACLGGNSTQFILDIEEDTSTLLKFDIVNLDGPVQKELLESIYREGIVIYEKV